MTSTRAITAAERRIEAKLSGAVGIRITREERAVGTIVERKEWVDASGVGHDITEMETSHIVNCVKLLARWTWEFQETINIVGKTSVYDDYIADYERCIKVFTAELESRV